MKKKETYRVTIKPQHQQEPTSEDWKLFAEWLENRAPLRWDQDEYEID